MQINGLELKKKFKQAKELLEERKDIPAVKHLRQLSEIDPGNHEIWLYLGIALRRIEDYDRAVECFIKTVELDRSNEEAWGLVTITLIDQGKIEEAKKVIEKAGQLNPTHEHIQFLRHNLVQTYTKFGPFF